MILADEKIGQKADAAKRSLLRYMMDINLQVGERLPSQNTLRQSLRLGTNTIAAAINSLKADGVVEVRDKVGVFLKTDHFFGQVGRCVGIGSNNDSLGAFDSCVAYYLQLELYRQGCQSIMFYYDSSNSNSGELDNYPGLRRCIRSGILDAFITILPMPEEAWRELVNHRIIPFHIGVHQAMSSEVVVDMEHFIQESLEHCRRFECRHPAIVIGSEIAGIQIRDSFFRNMMQYHFDPEAPGSCLFEPLTATLGRQLSQRLLALEPEQRPDALLFCDDNLAGRMATEFLLSGQQYEPWFFCIRNTPIPLNLPTRKAVVFELNIADFARTAIENLMRKCRESDTGTPAPDRDQTILYRLAQAADSSEN